MDKLYFPVTDLKSRLKRIGHNTRTASKAIRVSINLLTKVALFNPCSKVTAFRISRILRVPVNTLFFRSNVITLDDAIKLCQRNYVTVCNDGKISRFEYES